MLAIIINNIPKSLHSDNRSRIIRLSYFGGSVQDGYESEFTGSKFNEKAIREIY